MSRHSPYVLVWPDGPMDDDYHWFGFPGLYRGGCAVPLGNTGLTKAEAERLIEEKNLPLRVVRKDPDPPKEG